MSFHRAGLRWQIMGVGRASQLRFLGSPRDQGVHLFQPSIPLAEIAQSQAPHILHSSDVFVVEYNRGASVRHQRFESLQPRGAIQTVE